MNRHHLRWTAAVLGASMLGVLTACASTPDTTPPPVAATATAAPPPAASDPAASSSPTLPDPTAPMELSVSHIHAALRDPQTGALLLATHEGLFRQSGSELQQVGPVIDLMGFAVDPAGTLYASGHPSADAGLPEPVGLITSDDDGSTWQVLSRGGESDFHALAVSPQAVVGFDGALRTTKDGRSWTTLALDRPVISLAASPQSGTLLATTQAGLLRSDTDGASWETLTPPEAVILVAWADDTTAVAATVSGRLARSDDGGLTWTLGPKSIGPVGTLSAQRAANGMVEIIAALDSTVIATTDEGASLQVLVR
ncbi:MAG: F510_1955 family glycosylhydrolase [Dermatophilaceae bacterium]|nr:hypothetical protein [Intrasporangiaceae bacterium]